MGICEILTIIFVICKLVGVITWSWWLVLLPEIIAAVFYIIYLIFYFGIIGWFIRLVKKEEI